MSARRVAALVDSLLSDRRTRLSKVDPDDAEVLRAAITLRSARPGAGEPDEPFVTGLRRELALQLDAAPAPLTPLPARPPVRPTVARRARLLVGAAASVVMLGGTVAATTTVDHVLAAASGPQTSTGQLVRTASLDSTDGGVLGQAVAYRGNPSWVFMSVEDPAVSGMLRCQIEMDNGTMAATGTFVVRNGVGTWARPISLDVSRVRRATLLTPSGTVVATARFTSA